MFCACKIDIYHVTTTTSYSRTITVTWMLRFRGLILPLLTPSDWHGEWRRRPEAELAWLRGLGPPPSPALPPGPSSSLHSVIFVYGRGRVGRNYRWLHSTRYIALYLHYIYFISTLYLLCISKLRRTRLARIPGWRALASTTNTPPQHREDGKAREGLDAAMAERQSKRMPPILW